MSINLPLQSGRFLVEIGSEVVANFQECTGLTMEVEVQEYVEGGNNEFVHKLPGRVKYTNITLKRGVTDNAQFSAWRPKVEGGKITVEQDANVSKGHVVVFLGKDYKISDGLAGEPLLRLDPPAAARQQPAGGNGVPCVN